MIFAGVFCWKKKIFVMSSCLYEQKKELSINWFTILTVRTKDWGEGVKYSFRVGMGGGKKLFPGGGGGWNIASGGGGNHWNENLVFAFGSRLYADILVNFPAL